MCAVEAVQGKAGTQGALTLEAGQSRKTLRPRAGKAAGSARDRSPDTGKRVLIVTSSSVPVRDFGRKGKTGPGGPGGLDRHPLAFRLLG